MKNDRVVSGEIGYTRKEIVAETEQRNDGIKWENWENLYPGILDASPNRLDNSKWKHLLRVDDSWGHEIKPTLVSFPSL